MSDFQTADIDELLNSTEPAEPKEDFNEVMARYDRELMSFKPTSNRPSWPQPIRKRVCIK